ncbi:MAG: SH3 domain-containing protein [Chloroflexota bacterium]
MKTQSLKVAFSLAVISVFLTAISPPFQTKRTPITRSNIDQLQLGFALPNHCGMFSPDGKLMAISEDGLYDLATGQRRFSFSGDVAKFSSDSRLLAIYNDGIYDVANSERRFDTANQPINFSSNNQFVVIGNDVFDLSSGDHLLSVQGYPIVLSPDGRWLIVGGDGVYDISTRERLFATYSNNFAFRPDGRLLFADGTGLHGGVYDGVTGNPLFSTAGYPSIFSSDGRFLAVEHDGIYDTLNGSYKRLEFFGLPAQTFFSPDNRLLVVGTKVYDLETGNIRFTTSTDLLVHFSPDSKFVVSGYEKGGLYRVDSGTRLLTIINSSTYFNNDSTLLAIDDGLYDTDTSEQLFSYKGFVVGFNSDNTLLAVGYEDNVCKLYGLSNYPWPYRSGLIQPVAKVNLRETPEENATALFVADEELVVFARTQDHNWFKVRYENRDAWVATSVVNVIFMPDGVLVEVGTENTQ